MLYETRHPETCPEKGPCSWCCSGFSHSFPSGSGESHWNLLLGSLGAPWQEVTELMRALEGLLGNAPDRNRAANPETELKIQAQAAVGAVPSLLSLACENKSEGQVSCRCLLWGLLSPFREFFHFFNFGSILSHRILSCLSFGSSSAGKMLFPASLAMKSMVRAVPQLGGAYRGGSRRLSLCLLTEQMQH